MPQNRGWQMTYKYRSSYKRLPMTKTFLVAGFTTILLACNNNPKDNAAGSDSLNHPAVSETGAGTHTQNQMNPVTATMNRMMHEMHGAKPTGDNDVDFATMM